MDGQLRENLANQGWATMECFGQHWGFPRNFSIFESQKVWATMLGNDDNPQSTMDGQLWESLGKFGWATMAPRRVLKFLKFQAR